VIAPMVRSFLSQHNVLPATHAFETVSLAFGRKLVQTSDAVWFISRGVVASELEDGSLATLPLIDEPLGAPVGISTREDGGLSEEQRGLIAALEEAATG